MKKIIPILFCSMILAACSDKQATPDSYKKTVTTTADKAISKEEKKEYVNKILDIHGIVVYSLDDVNQVFKGTMPAALVKDPKKMSELNAALDPIRSEAAVQFSNLEMPPSKDLEELYKLESKYIQEAVAFVDIVPTALKGEATSKKIFSEKLKTLSSYTNQINDIVQKLDIK